MEQIAIVALILFVVLVGLAFLIVLVTRYKRCPSDKILVVYGKVSGKDAEGRGVSARCSHGGAAFVWPLIQDYQYLDLTPMPIEINLQGALEAGFRGGQVAQIVETNAHRKDDLNILRHTGQGLAIKFSGFLVFLCPEIGRCQQLQPVRVFRLQLERAFHVDFKGLVILDKQRCGGRL